jgi:hypothetical protein
VKIEFAKHNAAIYGVAECIEFIVGDFFQLAPLLKVRLFPSISYASTKDSVLQVLFWKSTLCFSWIFPLYL